MEIGAAAERSFQIQEEASKQMDNSQAKCIIIRGAVGSKCVNGAYEPTSEKHEGRVRYRMIGDEDKWIEHMNGDWCVKNTASKGENRGFAWVTGDCALEACASRTWRVFDQNGTKQNVEESSVTLSHDQVAVILLAQMNHETILLYNFIQCAFYCTYMYMSMCVCVPLLTLFVCMLLSMNAGH